MYLKLGSFSEARSLIVNGAFANQCIVSSIDYIKKLCSSNAPTEYIMKQLPHCAEGFYATESAQKMESFITRYRPPNHQNTMTNAANLSTTNESITQSIGHVSADYNSTSTKRRVETAGTKMKLIFVDKDASGGKRQNFDTLSSATLKSVFTEYANGRGLSLRSLRFSYNENTLFLSQVGKKALKDTGMKDQDVIVVTSVSQVPQEKKSKTRSNKGAVKPKHRTRPPKATKANRQGGGESNKQEVPAKSGKTQEELKIEVTKCWFLFCLVRNNLQFHFHRTLSMHLLLTFTVDSIPRYSRRSTKKCNLSLLKLGAE